METHDASKQSQDYHSLSEKVDPAQPNTVAKKKLEVHDLDEQPLACNASRERELEANLQSKSRVICPCC